MIMGAIYIIALTLLHLGIFHSIGSAAFEQTFIGMAEVVIEGANSSILLLDIPEIRDGFVADLADSLENKLDGSIEDIDLLKNDSPGADVLNITFWGYFYNILRVPICVRFQFRYEYKAFNVTYWFNSIKMQNFASDFEAECIDNGKNVAFFRYGERDCTFDMLDCEREYDLQQSYRYELSYNEGESVLYSFFCMYLDRDEEDEGDSCPVVQDWLILEWWLTYPYSNCSIEDTMYSYGPRQFLDAIAYDEPEGFSKIGTFPFSSVCLELDIAPAVIPVRGDRTWDRLPEWLKIGIRVLNGLSLAAFLFCFLTFVMFKELRNAHGKNVLSLVIAKMLSLFYTSGMIPLVTTNPQLCVFIAAVIYYAVLVPNYWWMAVAIFLAWTLGRKGIHRMDETSGTRIFLLLSLFGWGVPLLFTLLAVFLHVGGVRVFDIDDHCWIIPGWPNILITVQTFIPFFADCVLFILVVHRLRQTQADIQKIDSTGTMKRRNERQLTIKLAAIFGVFWLPSWIIYVAFLFVPLTGLAIAIQILNQLSTFVLPVVLCCNHRVAAFWKVKLAPLGDRFSTATSSTRLSDSRSSQPTIPNHHKELVNKKTPLKAGNEIQLRVVDN